MRILTIILSTFLTCNFICCIPQDQRIQQKTPSLTVTTFLQTDSLSAYKYQTERRDSSGKTLERIKFSIKDQSVSYIEKYSYDSIQRLALITETWFSRDKPPYTTSKKMIYDSIGNISTLISIHGLDTLTTSIQYHPNRKIKSSNTFYTPRQFKYFRTGITNYIYDKKDSCIRIDNYDLSGLNIQTHDSIVYTDTSKTIFEHNFSNSLSSKAEYFFKNGKLSRQIEYNIEPMSSSKEFYLDRQISFEYDKDNLTKKTVKIYHHTEWCGIERSEKTETYTYKYE